MPRRTKVGRMPYGMSIEVHIGVVLRMEALRAEDEYCSCIIQENHL